jgi:hypothetical protein
MSRSDDRLRSSDVAPPDSKERNVMDRQEIIEEQDRTGPSVPRPDEHSPQELAGGRS